MEKGLDEIKESWHCHYIQKSRHHTVSGIPNQLFYLPESVGTTDYRKVYDERDLREAEQSVSVVEDSNDIYQEYSYTAQITWNYKHLRTGGMLGHV